MPNSIDSGHRQLDWNSLTYGDVIKIYSAVCRSLVSVCALPSGRRVLSVTSVANFVGAIIYRDYQNI